jgi:preprotein translocase subunit SecA
MPPVEADSVARAGRIGAVTVGANMAGRGTDAVLGGNPKPHRFEADSDTNTNRDSTYRESEWKTIVDGIESKEHTEEEGRKVASMGGLHIVGTERPRSRDESSNQLRGRAGRQGDPGYFAILPVAGETT